MKKTASQVLVVALSASFILFLFLKFNTIAYLTFSDAAKFADIARNIVNENGYSANFSFFGVSVFKYLGTFFSASWVPPLMPLSIAAVFKIVGVSDLSVILTSSFYFVLLVVFSFLLGKKLFGQSVGFLSALAVGSSLDFLKYASTGASEPLFALEIVAGSYFISLRKKWATILAFVFMILLYFTRPQGFIYIAGLLLYWLLLNFKTVKAFWIFIGSLILGVLFDYLILRPLSGNFFLYSVITRGAGFTDGASVSGAVSNSLRGASTVGASILTVAKKVFYNLYNFYKLIPQILSPYLAGLFVINLFRRNKDKTQNSFKMSSLFMILVTLLVAAASIPFFRYIHPVVPVIYILAVSELVFIAKKIFKNEQKAILVSIVLVLVFITGQTIGTIFLDSRFEANARNVGRPPVYAVLSQNLKENTDPNQTIVTNLDTWGSWYGQRETVWFPLEPKQIIDPATGKIPFDAIYLTSYLIDDQNYYMGESWREIFNNPETPERWTCDGCDKISEEFRLKEIYNIGASDDYERQDASAILLIKK